LTPYGVVESKVELEAILGSHVKSEVVAFQLCGNIEQMRRERKLMRMHLRVSENSTPAYWDVIKDDSDEKGRSWQHRRA